MKIQGKLVSLFDCKNATHALHENIFVKKSYTRNICNFWISSFIFNGILLLFSVFFGTVYENRYKFKIPRLCLCVVNCKSFELNNGANNLIKLILNIRHTNYIAIYNQFIIRRHIKIAVKKKSKSTIVTLLVLFLRWLSVIIW